MARMFWRKAKAIGMYVNRRQWERDFDPNETAAYEIEIEQGGAYIIIESSNSATPNYIITE
jgi:hypothetical protein